MDEEKASSSAFCFFCFDFFQNLSNIQIIKRSKKHYGGVGYFSNERGFSVESSLQRISSKFLLWKRNDSSVVL